VASINSSDRPANDELERERAARQAAERAVRDVREQLQQARNALEAKYCLAYCAAVAYLDGKGGLAQFDDARVLREDVQALMRRVKVRVDPGLATGEGRFGVALTVKRKDGSRLQAVTDMPRGHPSRPLPRASRVQKFMQCAEPVLARGKANCVVEAVDGLEDIADLRNLTAMLCP